RPPRPDLSPLLPSTTLFRSPLFDVLHAGPDRCDRARPFVPRDDRVTHVARRPATFEHLDVRAADPGGAHADEHFAWTRFRSRHASQRRSAGPIHDDRTHLAHGTSRVTAGSLRCSQPSLKRKIPACVRGCSAQASWSRRTPSPGPVGSGKQPSIGSTAGAMSTSSFTQGSAKSL